MSDATVRPTGSAHPKVLVILDYYLPGYRAGGPPRSVSNMVQRLRSRFDFWVFTRNHDFADKNPYSGMPHDRWIRVDGTHCFYCSPDRLTLRTLRLVVLRVSPDIVYLNSFFSPLAMRVLFLRRLRLLGRTAFIVAPRGEFSPGALRLKWVKKSVYRLAARSSGLYRGVLWQASSPSEQQEIISAMGSRTSICIAPNLTAASVRVINERTRQGKKQGTARFVFLSRISPKKNLEYALRCLAHVRGEVRFDVYGPRENPSYWRRCEAAIERLPANVTVSYSGTVAPIDVPDTLSNYHFFLFPTLGENFGHVIFEALVAGCPVITTDRTPWQQLASHHAGWALPLEEPGLWIETLNRCVEMDEATHALYCGNAVGLATARCDDPEIEAQNITLFDRALAHRDEE